MQFLSSSDEGLGAYRSDSFGKPLLLPRRAHGWLDVDQAQRDALNMAAKSNRDMLANHPFYARFAIASGEFRAVTDKEIDGVVCAFRAIGDGVAALGRAARPDKEAFLAGALDGLLDFGRSGFVFWFDANHVLMSFRLVFLTDKVTIQHNE